MNDIVYSYTRTQAIEDGVLVDVSELAREAGFRIPVAVTRTVWCRYVEVTNSDAGQSEAGRLWDILFLLNLRIRGARNDRGVLFDVLIAKGSGRPRRARLKAICGPGDDAKPVITISLPEED